MRQDGFDFSFTPRCSIILRLLARLAFYSIQKPYDSFPRANQRIVIIPPKLLVK